MNLYIIKFTNWYKLYTIIKFINFLNIFYELAQKVNYDTNIFFIYIQQNNKKAVIFFYE